MIRSARELVPDAKLEADVCIVGTGAAGMTLALSLRDTGLKVLVLESGEARYQQAVQDLYKGEVSDERMHSPTDKYRRRVLGGSTTIWGGRCMPYDPIDFEARPHIAHSGWPIAYEEVARFYPQANALVEAGDFDYDSSSCLPTSLPPLPPGFRSERIDTRFLERFSCPTNFAARYQHLVARSAAVDLITDANVTHIAVSPNGEAVTHLACRTLGGKAFQVNAGRYVLATGGIENARLLLNARDVIASGLGNQHGQVGRYYMCHIAGNVGRLEVRGPADAFWHGYHVSDEGIYCRRRLTMPAALQRELGIANVIARLHFPTIAEPQHHIGLLSTVFLARRLISYEYGKRLQATTPLSVGDYLAHIRNVLLDAPDTASFLFNWVRLRNLAPRKFPSVVLPNKRNVFSLDVHGEQVPNPDSRIMLSEQRDAMGMQQVRVDWRYSPLDIESVRTFLKVLTEDLAASGTGSLSVSQEELEADLTAYGAYGGHHIGTTRMGLDPHQSVVNLDSQVHGTHNLYVAGSSVFPTSGQANPTLTIVAMALRLAEHLRSKACQTP
jgi:choline dehydrogenase-like flavoprotein